MDGLSANEGYLEVFDGGNCGHDEGEQSEPKCDGL